VEKPVSSRGRVISYEFTITALLILFWGSVGLNRIGIGIIAPYIKPEFGLSNFQIGFLVSGTSATWALSSWGGGWLSDRYGRRTVLLPGAILICVMTASMGIAGGFWSMLLIREFLGIGDGIGWSVGQATVYEETAPQRRAVNQALVSAGYTLIGAGLGALIITRISSNLGWRWAFPVIAAATAVVVAALFLVMRNRSSQAAQKAVDWQAAVGLLRSRSVIILIVISCAMVSWTVVMIAYNQLFLTEVRGFSKEDAGDIALFWGLAGAAGQLLLPLLSDFWGRRRVVFAGALVCAVTSVVYVAGGFGKVPMQILIGLSGFCGHGLLPLAIATCVVENVHENLRGSAIGLTNFCGVVIGALLMPLAGGILADHFGLVPAMWIPIAAQIIIATFIFMIAETAPRLIERRAAMSAAAA
jgi:predicted MFS family arabinose efflux permease